MKEASLGGEDLVTEIHGPGTVYLQTRNIPAYGRL
ncbi:MAG: AIM24 family protein [Methanolinea sp.]|nr:MAG: AIM24 family protein [Methanolinea sp.]